MTPRLKTLNNVTFQIPGYVNAFEDRYVKSY